MNANSWYVSLWYNVYINAIGPLTHMAETILLLNLINVSWILSYRHLSFHIYIMLRYWDTWFIFQEW